MDTEDIEILKRKRTEFMISNVKNKIAFKIQLLSFISLYSSQLLALEKNKALTPSESLLPMLTGLLAILAVIFLLAFIFKRFSNFGLASKNIKVIESQVIGNKEKLMIIQVQQQQFLIGVTGHTISQLGELNQTVLDSKTIVKEEKISGQMNPNEFDMNTLPFGRIISQLIKTPDKKSSDEKQVSPSSNKQREVIR